MRFITFTLYTVLLSSATVRGQDMQVPQKVIGKINAHYAPLISFRTDVAYNLYQDHTSNILVESDSAQIVRYKNTTWFKMGRIETLSDDKYDLMIHQEDKAIVVSNPSKEKRDKLPHLGLDSLLAQCSHFKLDTFGGVGCLYLGFAASEATGISICYRLLDYGLYSLTTYYRNERKVGETGSEMSIKPRLEIMYLRTDTTPKLDAARMNHNWFIKVSGKEINPTARFKHYQIFNQIIE